MLGSIGSSACSARDFAVHHAKAGWSHNIWQWLETAGHLHTTTRMVETVLAWLCQHLPEHVLISFSPGDAPCLGPPLDTRQGHADWVSFHLQAVADGSGVGCLDPVCSPQP